MIRAAGFREVPPYYDSAIPGTRYFALALAHAPDAAAQ
jgi:hypothetical protein